MFHLHITHMASFNKIRSLGLAMLNNRIKASGEEERRERFKDENQSNHSRNVKEISISPSMIKKKGRTERHDS